MNAANTQDTGCLPSPARPLAAATPTPGASVKSTASSSVAAPVSSSAQAIRQQIFQRLQQLEENKAKYTERARHFLEREGGITAVSAWSPTTVGSNASPQHKHANLPSFEELDTDGDGTSETPTPNTKISYPLSSLSYQPGSSLQCSVSPGSSFRNLCLQASVCN